MAVQFQGRERIRYVSIQTVCSVLNLVEGKLDALDCEDRFLSAEEYVFAVLASGKIYYLCGKANDKK